MCRRRVSCPTIDAGRPGSGEPPPPPDTLESGRAVCFDSRVGHGRHRDDSLRRVRSLAEPLTASPPPFFEYAMNVDVLARKPCVAPDGRDVWPQPWKPRVSGQRRPPTSSHAGGSSHDGLVTHRHTVCPEARREPCTRSLHGAPPVRTWPFNRCSNNRGGWMQPSLHGQHK